MPRRAPDAPDETAADLASFHQRLASLALEYTLTLNALREGILRLDRDGRVSYVNPAASRMLGTSAELVLGRPFHEAARHPPPQPGAACVACAAVQAGAPASLPMAMCGKPPLELECHITPLHLDGGRAGAVVVLQDVTERRRAEEARLEALHQEYEVRRLRDKVEMQSEFINTVAHELNTPLTPILLQMHLLRSRNGDASHGSWDILQRNLERLAQLVGDLLESARLQAGRMRLERREVALSQVVGEAAELFAETARQRSVRLERSVAPEVRVLGDASRLGQVLSNLLSNALKFTPPGGRVEVALETTPDEARVLVHDDGLGLAPQEAEGLFQPFAQSRGAGQPGAAGTGLGLYISKGIVEAHGGRIWCASPGQGRGATFGFALPLHHGDAALQACAPGAAAAAPDAAGETPRAHV